MSFEKKFWNVAPDMALQVGGRLRLYQVCGVMVNIMEDAEVMRFRERMGGQRIGEWNRPPE